MPSDIVPTLPDSLIPTEEDWQSVRWDWDTKYAYESFSGKTFTEAVVLIADDPVHRHEDFLHMPARCFPFYFQAYAAFVTSPDAQWECDAASCFLALCEFKGEGAPDLIRPMAPLLRPVLVYLATHQEFFDADVDIYGDFETRVKNILSLDCFKE